MKNKLHSDLYSEYLKAKVMYNHYKISQQLARNHVIELEFDKYDSTSKESICSEIHSNKWMLRKLQHKLSKLKSSIKRAQTKYNYKINK